MRKRAFTLVELLVVISIIAVLLSVLMPSLQKARGVARRVVCGSNLKQLGTAFVVYGNDNQDKLPAWRDGSDTEAPMVNHFLIINNLVELTRSGTGNNIFPKYIGNPKVFYCPNNDWSQYTVFQRAGDHAGWSPIKGDADTWSSYCYFAGGNRVFEQYFELFGTKLNLPLIKSPRRFSDKGALSPIMQDAWVWMPSANKGFINHPAKGNINSSNSCYGCNILFIDTHVKWRAANTITNTITWSSSIYHFATQ